MLIHFLLKRTVSEIGFFKFFLEAKLIYKYKKYFYPTF